MPAQSNAAATLRQSFDVYYRDAERAQRMDALNRQFLKPGDLAFDIGAHVGDRTGSFLRLGAKVIAAEPQPLLFRALRLLYGRNAKVTLECKAVGAKSGPSTLYINAANPTVSTLSPDLIKAAKGAPRWHGERWDETAPVDVITLDALIAQHGLPNFVKIDVEGHELAALQGLSEPIPALSFEFTTIQREVAISCLQRLSALGAYRFNLSLGEKHQLRHTAWVTARQMADELMALPQSANSGDVYANLTR